MYRAAKCSFKMMSSITMPYFDMWNISFTKVFFYIIDHKHCLKKNQSRPIYSIKPIKAVSIQLESHTNECYTGKRIVKLFIYINHFRENPFLSARFPGVTHSQVICVQGIILLSLVIFVNHDWTGSFVVL